MECEMLAVTEGKTNTTGMYIHVCKQQEKGV